MGLYTLRKYFGILFTLVLTSFFIFPFAFTFAPGVNTKMAMAGAGLAILLVRLSCKQTGSISPEIFKLSVAALVVSFIGWCATAYNNTSDYTYATYIVSMWVWLGGAYTLTVTMKAVHEYIDVKLLCFYMIAVCTFQCLIALGMEFYPWLKQFVDSFLAGEGFMGKMEGRLYGIGCALDVAGMKFAAILVMICYLITATLKGKISISENSILFLTVSFFIISVIGNMIARSTIIGIGISIGMVILYNYLTTTNYNHNINPKYSIRNISFIIIGFIALSVVLYNTNSTIKENLRFGFEGFFSLYEKGTWEVHSNDMLKNMVNWPESLKTWIIGDGYFNNPLSTNRYFIGEARTEYYQGTDIGYLRFIYYFGVLGLISFMLFFCKSAEFCSEMFPKFKWMFAFILIVNFAMWFKVSSDLFVIFAPFLCISKEEQQHSENLEKLKYE